MGVVEYFRREGVWAAADEELLHHWLSAWAIPNLATGGDILRWTQEAGFTDIQLVDIGPHVYPSSRRLYWLARLLWLFALGLHAVGLRSEWQQANIRGARDRYRAMRRGLWFEGVLTATATT